MIEYIVYGKPLKTKQNKMETEKFEKVLDYFIDIAFDKNNIKKKFDGQPTPNMVKMGCDKWSVLRSHKNGLWSYCNYNEMFNKMTMNEIEILLKAKEFYECSSLVVRNVIMSEKYDIYFYKTHGTYERKNDLFNRLFSRGDCKTDNMNIYDILHTLTFGGTFNKKLLTEVKSIYRTKKLKMIKQKSIGV